MTKGPSRTSDHAAERHRLISRRQVLAASAAGASAGAIGMPRARAQTATGALYEAAKKEGKFVWWCGCYDQPTVRALTNAFKATYPGVGVDYIWATGEVIYTRVQQNLRAGVREVNVFSTSNAGHWPQIKSQNALMPFHPSEASSLSKLFQTVDPDHTFRACGVETVAINYRSDRVTAPPRKWTDFLNPEWKNKLTFGSPVFSGDMCNWTVAMIDKYGDDYLTRLAGQNPKVGRSILGTGTDIVSGERLVGAGLIENTTLLKKGGSPIGIQIPEDDVILALNFMGILKAAPHPNAAKLFSGFVDSKKYSETLTTTYRFPIREDVPSANGFDLNTLPTYKSSIERLAKGTAGAIAQWRSALGI